jgi:rhodanese-related sulfurtransferase
MKNISVRELRDILNDKERDGNILVIDVRTPDEHRIGRIPQVVNMPLDEIVGKVEELKKYDRIYVHCQSGNRSQKACASLASLGLENAVNVEGGIGEWERLGFEVVRDGRSRMPLMRQVLLSAGLLILIGFALAFFVHPYFLGLPLFVGAGLTFAGATGHCLMAMLLAKMPWNR